MQKYHVLIRILHWLMALIILSLIGVGYYMTELPKDAPNRMDFYNLHKEFGFLILLLFVVRITTRLLTKAPELPKEISTRDKKLSKLGHYALYLFIFATPMVGLFMSNSFGYGVHFFGLDIPPFFAENKPLGKQAGEIHELLAYTMLGIVALHVAAVAKHYLIDKVNLLKRMA